MKLFLKLLIISTLLLSFKNSEENNYTVNSNFKSELRKTIGNTVWATKPDRYGRISTVFFKETNLRYLYKSDAIVMEKEWEDRGTWEIEEDYIVTRNDRFDSYRNKLEYGDSPEFWIISDDFSKISRNGTEEYFLTKHQKDEINISLSGLKTKYNYKDNDSHFNNYAFKNKYQENDSIKGYFDINSFMESSTNYKVQVKKEFENIKIIKSSEFKWYVQPDTPVIAHVSYPEVYTVINQRNDGNRIDGEFFLNTELRLKDIKSGQSYTIEPETKVKLLKSEYQNEYLKSYIAEIDLKGKKIKVQIPAQNIEPVYEKRWLYIKELNGWILSKYVQRIKDNSLEQIKVKQNTDGTITIGNQTWASKDLNVTHYNNGNPIFEAKTQKQWVEAQANNQGCFFRLKNGTFIYNGYAVIDKRGIAPKGFSVPSLIDFDTLFFNIGGQSKAVEILTAYEYLLIEEDYLEGGKIDISIKGDNSIGFSAQPGGFKYSSGYTDQGGCNLWWTSTQISEKELGAVYIGFCGEAFLDNIFELSNGIAIRAIKND